MKKNIEDTIFDDGMAVNSIAAANRLIEVMQENETNSLLSCKDDTRIRRLMWFLNAQVFGQMAKIDMMEEWEKLYKEFKELDKKRTLLQDAYKRPEPSIMGVE